MIDIWLAQWCDLSLMAIVLGSKLLRPPLHVVYFLFKKGHILSKTAEKVILLVSTLLNLEQWAVYLTVLALFPLTILLASGSFNDLISFNTISAITRAP